MGLHPGMKFKYTKGKAKGKIGIVIRVNGNTVIVQTSKSQYQINKKNLEEKVKWIT